MKKTMLILICIAAVLILAVGGVIWYLISTVSGAGGAVPKQSVASYLAEQWPDYRLERWDEQTQTLLLQRDLKLSYDQLVKYGDQPEMNDLVRGHLSTIQQISSGLLRHCGAEPEHVTVTGVSSDGQAAYTVSSDGSITTCWETAQDETP